jgi:heterodisulfide reductase subunit B
MLTKPLLLLFQVKQTLSIAAKLWFAARRVLALIHEHCPDCHRSNTGSYFFFYP